MYQHVKKEDITVDKTEIEYKVYQAFNHFLQNELYCEGQVIIFA